jgi:hypothetical protein
MKNPFPMAQGWWLTHPSHRLTTVRLISDIIPGRLLLAPVAGNRGIVISLFAMLAENSTRHLQPTSGRIANCEQRPGLHHVDGNLHEYPFSLQFG